MEFARERSFDSQSGATIVATQLGVPSRALLGHERSARTGTPVPILDNGVRKTYGLRPYRRAAADKGYGR